MPPQFSSTLRQFLTSGQIGLLSVGTTRQATLDMLGEPDHWSERDEIGWKVEGRNRAAVWYYGVLRIYFASDCIRRLVFCPEAGKTLPAGLNFSGYFPDHDTTPQAFIQYLEQNDLDYHKDDRCAADKVCLLVEQTAYIMFDSQSILSLAYPR